MDIAHFGIVGLGENLLKQTWFQPSSSNIEYFLGEAKLRTVF